MPGGSVGSTRTTSLASAIVILSLTLLTACGPGGAESARGKADGQATASAQPTQEATPLADLSGAQLQDKALAATRDATSLRLRVHEAEGGVDIDITVDRKGQCRGSMSLADGTISHIRTTDVMFFKPNEAFVRRQWAKGLPPKEADSVVAKLAGRWSKVRRAPQRRGHGTTVQREEPPCRVHTPGISPRMAPPTCSS
jgi:hypothetical protein